MPKYPKVNYIGNKEKLVKWIIDEIPIKKGSVLDIFAGGCSVSYALKLAGYSVISNDILYADFVIAKALIENNNDTLSMNVFNQLIDKNHIDEIEKNIEFLKDRLYYPAEVKELAKLIAISENIKGNAKYIFLALLRRAMIRKLPYSRMNVPWDQIQLLRDEDYSYRKYRRKRAYHNQTFESHMIENLTSYNEAVFSASDCRVYNYDAIDILKKINHVNVIYMDPPYPSTMNNYDAFYGLFDDIFNKKNNHTDFTKRITFLKNLEALVKTASLKTDYILLSQNTGVKPEPHITKSMLEKYGTVIIKEKKHNYQVTGKENKNSSKELLFIIKIYKK